MRDVLSHALHSREIHRRQAGATVKRTTEMHDHECAAQMMRVTCVSTEVCSQQTNHHHSLESSLLRKVQRGGAMITYDVLNGKCG
jgi:hypothetical protein